ncbi:MAG: hypothetical protein R3C03_10345 [Pirellulaceae bacterium]
MRSPNIGSGIQSAAAKRRPGLTSSIFRCPARFVVVFTAVLIGCGSLFAQSVETKQETVAGQQAAESGVAFNAILPVSRTRRWDIKYDFRDEEAFCMAIEQLQIRLLAIDPISNRILAIEPGSDIVSETNRSNEKLTRYLTAQPPELNGCERRCFENLGQTLPENWFVVFVFPKDRMLEMAQLELDATSESKQTIEAIRKTRFIVELDEHGKVKVRVVGQEFKKGDR